jgi:diketogulonate reductase-like aldo/keto reductase
MKKGSIGIKPENFAQPDFPLTWQAMEAVYDSGKARAIGVSNFSTKKLADLLEVARVPPAVNQVECHPAWNQAKLHSFCQSKGVHLSVSSQLLACFSIFFLRAFCLQVGKSSFQDYNALICLHVFPSGIFTSRISWHHMAQE